LKKSFAPLEAVIFDCDGVLVDSEPLHYQAFQTVLEPLGLGYDYSRYLEHFIGFDDRDGFLEAFRETGRSLDDGALARLVEAKARAFGEIVLRGVQPFPGVQDLVRELREQGVPLAVASGALRAEIVFFLEALGLREAFQVIVAADDVARSKPDPQTYRLAFEQLKDAAGLGAILSPRTFVAIEDTPAGIRSARAAGLHAVAVAHSHPAADLREADTVVEALADLDLSRLVGFVAGDTHNPM